MIVGHILSKTEGYGDVNTGLLLLLLARTSTYEVSSQGRVHSLGS